MRRLGPLLVVVLICAFLVRLGGLWWSDERANSFALELEAAWQALGDVARQVGCQAALSGADRLADAIQDVASCAAQRALGRPQTYHNEPTFEPHASGRL